jgi:hypothetical protein
MPFTLFHLGPGLGLALPLRKYMHAPTFVVASVFLDVEPFLVMSFGLNFPLHGYMHTLLFAITAGLLLGYVMSKFERHMQSTYRLLLLETNREYGLKSYLVAGVGGAVIHVLLDAPLYGDIHPFFPFAANPFLRAGAFVGMDVFAVCIWMGFFAMAFYAALVLFRVYKHLAKKSF